jgi:hypothetical protein
VIFRRRYSELVGRQLDLFALDNADLLAECQEALRAYDAAPRDEAEERYAVYDDLLDTGRELLAELRDGYARSLEDDEAYLAAFDRAALKRFPRLASGLPDV